MINIKNNSRLLFIGDSITDIKFNKKMNRKIRGRNSYPLVVTKELKNKYYNLKFFYKGIASNRSYNVYDRLTKDCIELRPDVIVMLIGVNDAWEAYVPEQYPPLLRPFDEHMKEIFRRLKMELPNAKLIVMTPFLIDTIDEKKPFHNILEKYIEKELLWGKEFEADIIELQKVFDKASNDNKCSDLARDGVHPTNLGHEIIAKEILKILS